MVIMYLIRSVTTAAYILFVYAFSNHKFIDFNFLHVAAFSSHLSNVRKRKVVFLSTRNNLKKRKSKNISKSSSKLSVIPFSPWSDYQQTNNENKAWYSSISNKLSTEDLTLPFDCTACGKCCKTKGDVYLSPKESKEAAKLLGISIAQFKKLYVSKEEVTVSMSLDAKNKPGDTGWVVLKSDEKHRGCVFLNSDNTCGIYDARPTQCSTYPFWPRIMASREAWNSEVCLNEEHTSETYQEDGAIGKYWTIEDGGCEGMGYIGKDLKHQDKGFVGVSISEASERLEMYRRYKRRFPQGPFSSTNK